ncbi:hypothetical protein CS379_09380, partial [Methylobacterium frigidaeris]
MQQEHRKRPRAISTGDPHARGHHSLAHLPRRGALRHGARHPHPRQPHRPRGPCRQPAPPGAAHRRVRG